MNKFLLSFGSIAVFTLPVAAASALWQGGSAKQIVIEVKISEVRDNVRLWQDNYDAFTNDGNQSDGSFAPIFRPDLTASDYKKFLWLNIASWSLVQNYLNAYPGLEVTLNWQEGESFKTDSKKFDDGLEIIMIALDGNTISLNKDATHDSNEKAYGEGVLSSDGKKLTFIASQEDVMTMWFNSYNVYNNNWGVFNKNEDWRSTMDRLGTTIRHSDGEFEDYTEVDMRGTWETTVRGTGVGDTTSLIKYTTEQISDDIFSAAANYANAVIGSDDNVLGWHHIANAQTPYQYQNRAVMTMDGGPVPDADRLTMLMNNYQSNYQSVAHIFPVNEGQYGVLPKEIVLAEGQNSQNKYLVGVQDAADTALLATVTSMVTNSSIPLSNKAALLLMAGNLDIAEQELWIATGFAYSSIDADRATLLAKHLRSIDEVVNVEGSEKVVKKYDTVAVAGRSHGMQATLDAVLHGRDQSEFLANVDFAFPEKNVMFPATFMGGTTGYRPTNTDLTYIGTNVDFDGKSRDQLYRNYENPVKPSLNNFNQTTNVVGRNPIGDDEYVYADNDYKLAGSNAPYRFYDATRDFNLFAHYDINDERVVADDALHADSMAPMTRRFAKVVFGYVDGIEIAIAKGGLIADFMLNKLWIEANQRDPNIGSVWQEEVEWALNLGLNYSLRDNVPNLYWFNNEDDNTGRGQHHEQAPAWVYHPRFGIGSDK